MTQAVDIGVDAGSEVAIRDVFVDKLVGHGMITSPGVEAAFRAVPRARFTPAGTPLDVVYNPSEAVTTKTDERGVAVSSVSAPFIQAQMIEYAEIEPGMSVLEIGSGGYNAALLAEVVGRDGLVVSMDIDRDVTERATEALAETGYAERVKVVLGDAEHGVPGMPRFDRIIVTVGAWDIPPSWLNQLAEDGRIVLPLRVNGINRTVAFRREGDHLVSTHARPAGFVTMQGDGAHPERRYQITDRQGRTLELRFDDGELENPALLDGVLNTDQIAVWSGVTVARGATFADLHLWCASHLTGYCKLAVGHEMASAQEGGDWLPFGLVQGDSIAGLAIRPTASDESRFEFGALAYGAHAEEVGQALVKQVRAWDEVARGGAGPTFTVWPADANRADHANHTRLSEGTALITKQHSVIGISWPG